VWGRAAFLPEGSDPDSFIRRHGRSAMEGLLEAAPSLVDFYFDQTVPPGTPLPQRARAAEDVKAILARVRNDVQFEMLARHAAARLGVSEEVFRRARAATPAPRATAPASAPAPAAWPPAELALVEAMAVDREVAEWAARHDGLALVTSGDLADAGRRIVGAWEDGHAIAEVVETLPEELGRRLTSALLGEGPLSADADRMRLAEDCVRRLQEEAERARRRAIAADLRRAETAGDASWRSKLEDLQQIRRRDGGAR
jgi:DNA primase